MYGCIVQPHTSDVNGSAQDFLLSPAFQIATFASARTEHLPIQRGRLLRLRAAQSSLARHEPVGSRRPSMLRLWTKSSDRRVRRRRWIRAPTSRAPIAMVTRVPTGRRRILAECTSRVPAAKKVMFRAAPTPPPALL